MNTNLTIGEVAGQTDVPAKTIRYYEEAGLLPRAQRAANGYRVYDEQAVHVLRFIKRSRDLGFSMHDVGELLALWADATRESAQVKAVATRHLEEIEAKIKELKGMRRTLRQLMDHCHGDDRPDCPILKDLAAPRGKTSTSGSATQRPARPLPRR